MLKDTVGILLLVFGIWILGFWLRYVAEVIGTNKGCITMRF
jgi:hypothetical protein